MLLSLQFPLADSRCFVENTGRLPLPAWPLPTPDSQFIRFFGPVRIRKSGGLTGWLGENEICEANRALILERDATFLDRDANLRVVLRRVFQRFYFDGWAVGKFEFAVGSKKKHVVSISRKQTQELITSFLKSVVQFRDSSAKTRSCCSLVDAGKHLAQLYMRASTVKSHEDTEAWWVQPGPPLLLLEVGSRDVIQIPYWAKPMTLPSYYGFQLFYCLVPFSGRSIRTWILKLDEFANYSNDLYKKARTLRLYLLRLHAEHECLRTILESVRTGKIAPLRGTEQSNSLQHYLNQATRRIGRLEAKSGEEIADVARHYMDVISPGHREALFSALDVLDPRKNLVNKLRAYTEAGTVTLVERMEVHHMGDVFKDVNQSIIATRGSIAKGVIVLQQRDQEEIAAAISSLEKLIVAASDDALPAVKKDESFSLIKGIAEEATKETPNKTILRSLGESLLSIIVSVEPLAKAGKAAFEVIRTLWS